MTEEKLDKLKKFCQENDLEFCPLTKGINSFYIAEKEVVPEEWKDVQYVFNKVRKIHQKVDKATSIGLKIEGGGILFFTNARPSTEEDYLKQLELEQS